MAALTVGAKAPEFELKTLDGKKFSLSDELARGPVVAAFFKVSCPTCQYALPFLERLYKAYAKNGVTLVGISQNDAKGNCGIQSAIRHYVSGLARRHALLSGLECLRADERSLDILDRPGWRD